MYRWYQACTVSYAYLTDVPNGLSRQDTLEKFRRRRWFTRGWTLQELISPATVEIYGAQLHTNGHDASLGTKHSLQTGISEMTQIPENALETIFLLPSYTIAQKMLWLQTEKLQRSKTRRTASWVCSASICHCCTARESEHLFDSKRRLSRILLMRPSSYGWSTLLRSLRIYI